MPLFTVELNRLADEVRKANWTVYLHTAAPTDGSPTNGRTTVGGAAFENGIAVAMSAIDAASAGDIANTGAIDFGTADEAVGTVAWASVYRGTDPVGYVTLPSTVIADGDSFLINAGTLQINGSTT